MAATIKLVTYSGQTVTPKNDAIVYDASVGRCGIFYGCDVTANGNTVYVSSGYGMIRGRFFEIEASTLPVTLPSTDTLLGRLYIRLDLSNTEAPLQLLTATGSTLPALEQDDEANYVDGVYEMEMATFNVSSTEVTDVVETYEVITDNGTLISTLQTAVDTLNSNLCNVISVADTTTSVPTGGGDSTVLQTVTLQPGKYIFIAMVSYASNSSGMRGASISTSSSIQLPYYVSVSASNGGSTSMQVIRYIDATNTVTLRVTGRQTSGSSLSTTTHSTIIQLK